MHMRRRTKPAKDMSTSQVRRPPMRLIDGSSSRFAATLNAARVTPPPEVAAYQQGYRDSADCSRALMLDLAAALEAAMAVGWPDEAEPRNVEWRRLIWRARRTPR